MRPPPLFSLPALLVVVSIVTFTISIPIPISIVHAYKPQQCCSYYNGSRTIRSRSFNKGIKIKNKKYEMNERLLAFAFQYGIINSDRNRRSFTCKVGHAHGNVGASINSNTLSGINMNTNGGICSKDKRLRQLQAGKRSSSLLLAYTKNDDNTNTDTDTDTNSTPKYTKTEFGYIKKEIEIPDYFKTLIQSYDNQKPLSTSRSIVYQCEQINDKPSLEATIDYLISNTIAMPTPTSEDNNVKETKITSLTSLITPREQTNLIRLLGRKGMFYTMLYFLKHLSTDEDDNNNNNNDSLNNEKKDRIANIQYLYTAAITALAQSPNPKYRKRSKSLLDDMDKLGIEPNSYVITAAFLAVDGGKAAREMMRRTRSYTSINIDVHIYNSAIYACSRSGSISNGNGSGSGSGSGSSSSNTSSGVTTEGGRNGWQPALSLFRQMPKEGIKPNQQTYASLLQACAKSGQVKVAFSLFDEMRNTPGVDIPGVKVWGAVLKACSVAGDWERAMKLILDMDHDVTASISASANESVNENGRGRRPGREKLGINTIHLNSLLATLAKAGNDMTALEVLNAMHNGQRVSVLKTFLPAQRQYQWDSKVDNNADTRADTTETTLAPPDLVSINTVLTAFAERNKKSEALKLLGRMKEGEFASKRGPRWFVVKPDIISYNTVLSTFQEPADAVSLLHEIRMTRKSRHNPLKPTCQTYTNAISICSRADPPNLEIALTLLRDASKRDGIRPNNFMYSATIWTAERCGDSETALSLLREMHYERCKPNTVCYNGVMAALAKNGKFKEAILLFHEMKKKQIPLSLTTFQQLAAAATRCDLDVQKMVGELEKVLTLLNKQELQLKMSGCIYDVLIRGYGAIGKFEDALRVFNRLDQTNALCLSSILFVCSTASPARWRDAILILHSSDIVAGAQGPGKIEAMALSYAVIACSKENQWEEAINLLKLYGVVKEQQTPAVSVDAINSAIAAAGRCGRPDIALKTLNEMNSKYSIQPNERTYRSAIVACNQAEHEKLRQRTKNTISRDNHTDIDNTSGEVGAEQEVNDVSDDQLSLQWWEAALSLLRRMKEDCVQPSIQTYSSVISACEAAGQWQRAIGILSSMTRTEDVTCQPNLFCFNAALAACEKGNAWLEAFDLYERMKEKGGSVRPNFISMNSLLIALDKGEQRELAESVYNEALRDKIISPWKYTLDSNHVERIRAMDLHQFSVPMAKIAVRNVFDSLLQENPSHVITKDLIIVLGKGKGSVDGKTKLMPIVRELLKVEYDVNPFIEETNSGRIRIRSKDLAEFTERRCWK